MKPSHCPDNTHHCRWCVLLVSNSRAFFVVWTYNNLLGEFSQGTLWDSVFQGDKIQIQRIGLGWQKFPAIAPLESPITVFCFQMPHSWRSTNCTTILLFFCFVMKPTYLGTRGFHYLRNTGSPWGGLKINNNSKTIRISCTWGSKRKKKITLLPINTMRQTNFCFSHWSFHSCALSVPTILYSKLAIILKSWENFKRTTRKRKTMTICPQLFIYILLAHQHYFFVHVNLHSITL